jgi:endonuclease/exonuclease/phosphatase family metal-dependent hydrolase
MPFHPECTPHSSRDAAFFVARALLASLAVLSLSSLFLVTSCRKERTLGTRKAVPVRNDGVLRLRALTLNARYENQEDRGTRAWKHRIHGIVRAIRQEQPDVFGIQETLHGQIADVWASLTDYELHGAGRDDGQRSGEYTALFFRRDRFEEDPSECGVFWLSDTPNRPGSATWGNTLPRMVAWKRLIDRSTQRGFTVYSTHWDHMHQESRMKSAQLMRAHIRARTHANEPVVVLGDLNARRDNPAVQSLTTDPLGPPNFLNAYHTRHPAETHRTTLHFWKGSRDGMLMVDHILVSAPARIRSAFIRDSDQPMISDHFPVVAEFEFAP